MGESASEQRLHVRVMGLVQGVGFRWWLWRRARELGVRGTVRNAADGSVEVEAAGSAAQLSELRELLRAGPPVAHVRALEELPPSSSALPDSFEIVH